MYAENLLIKLGKVIQCERNKLGFSQEELADRAGVHRTYIGMVERGEKNITIKNLSKIATALNISLADILRRAERVRQV